jgi:hypothetical protein
VDFKDLHKFNLALLGKHVWRLLTNPTSLCAQVLLGRYCHNQNLMEVNAPRTASKTWCVILAGREALKLSLLREWAQEKVFLSRKTTGFQKNSQ